MTPEEWADLQAFERQMAARSRLPDGPVSPPKRSITESITRALAHRKNVAELDAELPESIRRQFGWVDRSKH